MDRVVDFESKGWGFESLRGRLSKPATLREMIAMKPYQIFKDKVFMVNKRSGCLAWPF